MKKKRSKKNFEFWTYFPHAFEASLGYSKKLNHGEAVILGIVTALKFSLNIKLIKLNDYRTIINHVLKIKLPSNINNFFTYKDINKILTFMSKDKKNYSKKIKLILLKKIGSTVINNNYDSFKIKNFLTKELINKNL